MQAQTYLKNAMNVQVIIGTPDNIESTLAMATGLPICAIRAFRDDMRSRGMGMEHFMALMQRFAQQAGNKIQFEIAG